MNVGITGMVGFLGWHLRCRLQQEKDLAIQPFEDSYFTDLDRLKVFVAGCDAIVHLAAMNRGDPDELYRVNVELVTKLVAQLEAANARPHVILSSSTQIDLDNPYGRSKKEGARLLEEWAKRCGAPLTVLVIPNVFGGYGQPFYNSVVATFCHQLATGGQPQIQQDREVHLIYVRELTDRIHQVLRNPPKGVQTVRVEPTSRATVSQILKLLERYKEHYFQKRTVPKLDNAFEANLYRTFLTYLNAPDYEQHPPLHADPRGSLFEVVKDEAGGQVFFSTTKPGITRGNHFHTRKLEKFCVVRGEAVIRLRRIGTGKVIEYRVSGEKPAVVEMPILHTHNITNVGQSELLTLFWTNELFDPADPDTFYEDV